MKKIETKIQGFFIMQPEPIHDNRGFFTDLTGEEAFGMCRWNLAFNKKAGTLRGMHYQENPVEEEKIVWCKRGAIYDVVLDLRPWSDTFGQWEAVGLSDMNRLSIFIPKGLAHGYQTLLDETEVLYGVSQHYFPKSAKTVKWNDQKYKIKWPLPVTEISEKDK